MKTAELQQQFMASLFERNSKIFDHIQGSTIPPEGRMKIYRNSTFGILTQTLKDCYPVLHLLVGDDFFESMAIQFIEQHKPDSGDITKYGWGLPKFLENFEPASAYPYFIEVTTLELHRQKAYYANNQASLKADMLMDITEAELSALKCCLQPHVFYDFFQTPAYHIWSAHQNDDIEKAMATIDINTSQYTLTYRYGLDIFSKEVSKETYTFLRRLEKTQSLQEAIEAQIDFNPQETLEFLLQYNLLTNGDI
jgi:hypothetical protein